MRRLCLLLTIALVPAVWADEAPTYKQDLIRRFPFYNVAHEVFTPVYPAFARQLVDDYGITKGVCVDVGGAEGSLAVELAKITELTVYVADLSPFAVRLCNLAADEEKLTGRVRAVEADAQALPFRDGFADLVVSRNSIFEWPDKLAGIKEAYRVLKPGGVALLGGGFSRLLAAPDLARLLDWCRKKRAQKSGDWTEMDPEILKQARAAGIDRIRRLEGPTEFDWWLEIRR